MNRSEFIPNSFQTPNAYVDRLMSYLTDPELRVLLYAARRIFGFNKRQDNIALSQFTNGIKDKDGNALDEGTGLSLDTARKALACLVSFNILIRVKDNPRPTAGDLYELQLDSEAVNWTALHERREAQQAAGRQRIAPARAARKQPLLSDKTGLVPQNDTPLVPQNDTPLVPQKHNNQGNTEKHSISYSSNKSARDPRTNHPAIQCVRAALHFYPPKAAWDAVIKELGDAPDTARFQDVATEWALRGGSPKNLRKMLDWYRHGIPQAGPGAPAQRYETAQERKLRMLDEQGKRFQNGNHQGSA